MYLSISRYVKSRTMLVVTMELNDHCEGSKLLAESWANELFVDEIISETVRFSMIK